MNKYENNSLTGVGSSQKPPMPLNQHVKMTFIASGKYLLSFSLFYWLLCEALSFIVFHVVEHIYCLVNYYNMKNLHIFQIKLFILKQHFSYMLIYIQKKQAQHRFSHTFINTHYLSQWTEGQNLCNEKQRVDKLTN